MLVERDKGRVRAEDRNQQSNMMGDRISRDFTMNHNSHTAWLRMNSCQFITLIYFHIIYSDAVFLSPGPANNSGVVQHPILVS